jgi:hypothetical protein
MGVGWVGLEQIVVHKEERGESKIHPFQKVFCLPIDTTGFNFDRSCRNSALRNNHPLNLHLFFSLLHIQQIQ